MSSRPLPTFFVSHGGGPWPWMEDGANGAHAQLAASLRELPALIGARPAAVLMVSAHWEAPEFTVMTAARPGMLYDYGGFPEHTYHVRYAAPGAPEVAARVRGLLETAGIGVREDAQRGYDHGLFAPMAVIFPNADVPVLQLSLRRGLDPREHLALGRALAPLRAEGIAIIGSGLSFHNLRAFGPQAREPSAAFDAWLDATLRLPLDERAQALIDWEQAPAARLAHPREEHLLPLMVAVGAAHEAPATRIYHQDDFFGGISVSSWGFGLAP